ncbi:Hypothetical protein A7982_10182 [Minicystis rosea]|nr:Hypothetical protein A7982_10182 [Minicystis rosea]
MKKLLAMVVLPAALSACSGQAEKLSPLVEDTVDAGGDAAPPVVPGPVKRTVMMRNPFGGRAGNLLVDGDFELSTVANPGAQLGWRGFSADGSADREVATETGGLCRSGLRCAVMEPSTLFLIRGAAAKGKGNIASGWAKVPEGSFCSVVRPMLIGCNTFIVLKQISATKNPDADGWCHYTASVPEQDNATCVYVETTLKAGTSAILDAFTLGPDDGTVQPLAAEFWAPEPDLAARLESLRAHVAATLPLGKKPEKAKGPSR